MALCSVLFYAGIRKYAWFDYASSLDADVPLLLRGLIFASSAASLVYVCALSLYSYFAQYAKNKGPATVRKNLFHLPFVFIMVFAAADLIVLPFLFYQLFRVPPFSAALLYLLSGWFGFALAMEVRLESDPSPDPDLEKTVRRFFDNSVAEYLPPVAAVLLVVVPAESIFTFTGADLKEQFAAFCTGLVPAFALAYAANRKLSRRFDIRPAMSRIAHAALSVMSVMAVILCLSWEIFLAESESRQSGASGSNAAFLIFSGVIPLRMLCIAEPGIGMLSRGIGLAGVIVYGCVKFRLL